MFKINFIITACKMLEKDLIKLPGKFLLYKYKCNIWMASEYK